MGNTFRFTVLFLGWMALITYLSLDSFSSTDLSGISIPHLDKAVHFTFYFGVVFLGCLFVRERTKGIFSLERSTVLMFIVALFYGIIIEVLQEKITVDRDGNWYDAMANITGAIIGSIVIRRLFSQSGRLKWEY